MDEALNSQEIPANSSSRLHNKLFSNLLYTTMNPPQTSLKAPVMLLIRRWICFYPGQQSQVRITL